MKIQLKRSNQLQDYGNGNEAKRPTAAQMEYGELAVNYNSADPAIFMEDSLGNIVRIAGAGSEGSFSGDYNDLTNQPTIGDATITIKSFGGDTVGTFTTNQDTPGEITLPEGTTDTNTTYEISSEDAADAATSILRLTSTGDGAGVTDDIELQGVNGLTVTQAGNNKFVFTIPETATIYPPSGTAPNPGNESNGDIWIDTTECPPVLKIWSDCDGTGQWYELTSSGPKPINPQPGDGNESITPPVSGGGTQVDPYILTPLTVSYGATGETVETITLSNQTVGNLVQFIDNNSGTNGLRFEQPVGVVGANGSWSGKLYFEDTPTSSADGTFTGLLSIGGIYYQWAVTVEPALSLTVGKGAISPSSGEAGDTFTGSAAVTDAVNPVVINVFYVDGVEVQRGSSASYFATETGELTYRKEVTDDDNQSAVIGELSDPVTVLPATKPTAVMNGLRFEQARDTYLQNAGSATGNWTFSGWVKSVGQASTVGYLLADSGTTGISLKTDSNVLRWRGGGTEYTLSDTPIPKYIWTHVVVTAESSVLQAYVNGETQAAKPTVANSNFTSMSIGKYTNNGLDGYLSDVYFVDGAVLKPEVFGKNFGDPGKWGPLDSSVVLENIKGKAKSPYDERPNYDQKWSEAGTNSGWSDNPFPRLFDGQEGSYDHAAAGTQGTWNYVINDVTSLKINIWVPNIANHVKADDVKINGNDIVQEYILDAGLSQDTWHTIDLGNIGTFQSLYLDDSYWYISSITINGRMLVDGPADNSQQWSDYLVSDSGSYRSGNTPDKAFNGDGGATISESSTQGTNSTLTFTPPAGTFSGSVNVEILSAQSTGVSVYITDGSGAETLMSNAGNAWTATVNGVQSFKVEGNNGTAYADVRQVTIDGKILIDSGAQWDQSQVWSDSFTCDKPQNVGKELTNAFDGDLTTLCNEQVGGATYTFEVTETGNYQVYMYSNGGRDLKVDGIKVGEVPVTSEGQQTWYDIGTVSAGETITIEGSSGGSFIYGWKLNDTILVDQGNFGNNGFFLPFDPASNVVDYPSQLSAFPDWEPGDTPDKAFNGNPTNLDKASATQMQASVAESIVTWIPAEPVTSFEVYTVLDPSGAEQTYTYSMNDGSFTANGTAGTGWRWHDLTAQIPAGGMTKFVHKATNISNTSASGSAAGGAISGIKVNGKELIQPSAIGTDASGNGNHFQDQNFAAGNTDKVWSSDFVHSGQFDASFPLKNLFDGNKTSIASTGGSGTGGTGSIDLNISGNGPYTVVLNPATDSTTPTLDGVNPDFKDGNICRWDSVASVGTLAWPSGAVGGRYIEVNGEVLVDGNIQDTVLDTPMKSYAVWGGDNGENGNLRINNLTTGTSGGFTLNFGSRDKVYFETIKNNATGFAHVGVKLVGSSSETHVRGDRDPGSDTKFVSGTPLDFGENDIVGCAVDVTNNQYTVYVNGVEGATYGSDGAITDFSLASPMANGGDGNIQTSNFGQQPFAASNVTHNLAAGTVEIDGDIYQTLYQTWEQYARTTIGYALDRITKLEALRLLDAATIEDLRTQIAGALSRIASIESDEVNDDAVDNSLITLVGSLSSQITTWTQRIETAETNLSTLTSRVTTLES